MTMNLKFAGLEKQKFQHLFKLQKSSCEWQSRSFCLIPFNKQVMHFIDIAANLTDDMYKGMYNGSVRHAADLSAVLSRASDGGVVRTMVTAGTLSQCSEALNLCRTDASLFSTVGVHPTRASEMRADIDSHIRKLSAIIEEGMDKVVAVGECGLDYDRLQFCSKEEQIPGFIAQFKLAEESKLPMFLHDRNTSGDFGRIVKENRHLFSTGVVHSFTGTEEEMNNYVNMDLYIGINGCSLKTEDNLNVVKQIPLDRIMLETDCPYCGVKQTHAGFHHVKSTWAAKDKKKHTADAMVKNRNEPCQIRQVCEVVAGCLNISEEDLARAAFNNTMRVFFPKEAAHMGSSPYDWSVNAL